MESIDTATEVQQTEAETPGEVQAGEVQAPVESENNGVQKRINELTKKFRDQERVSETLRMQNQELMQTLTQTVAQMSQNVKPVEPAFEMDTDEKKKFDYLLSPLQKQLAQLQAQLNVNSAHQEIQGVASEKNPPEVMSMAKTLLEDWRRKGIPGTAQDAVTYAMGRYVLSKGDEEQVVATQRQSFNKGAATVQTGQGGSSARGVSKDLSDAQVEQLSPKDQAAYFSSRLGDQEF